MQLATLLFFLAAVDVQRELAFELSGQVGHSGFVILELWVVDASRKHQLVAVELSHSRRVVVLLGA